ncbi:Pao retrotransposon peptidase family protein [Trichinella spiralis]|uniref:Pao retrotransposon peptidase family protein n=1 Tax=Trichinella spiralis TaxID=6334 RepID=UPI0001EFE1EA|nr:Pao retrotransposon peptidase family protein [Trichinella spiralis]
MMFQSLWTLGLSWDSPLPPKISKQWRSWQEELKKPSQIKLSRPWLSRSVKQVHIFGDASQAAYAASAYLGVESLDGEISVKLMIAKTRVTPVRHISLPRLELMAALLCERLKNNIVKEVTLLIQETLYWSDSKVVLAWIRGSSKRWKPFVANRVEEIQSVVSPRQWKYCPTKEKQQIYPVEDAHWMN